MITILKLIKEKSEARSELRTEIKALATKRNAFLKQKVKAAGLEENTLDSQMFDAIREQSADKGLVHDKKNMKY